MHDKGDAAQLFADANVILLISLNNVSSFSSSSTRSMSRVSIFVAIMRNASQALLKSSLYSSNFLPLSLTLSRRSLAPSWMISSNCVSSPGSVALGRSSMNLSVWLAAFFRAAPFFLASICLIPATYFSGIDSLTSGVPYILLFEGTAFSNLHRAVGCQDKSNTLASIWACMSVKRKARRKPD